MQRREKRKNRENTVKMHIDVPCTDHENRLMHCFYWG